MQIPTPLLAQSSTAADWNTLLITIRDLGIAMLALVVLGLAIVGYIIDQRNKGRSATAENKVVSDMVSALSKVVEDYKGMVTAGEVVREHDKQQSIESLVPIGEGLNRLADILDALKKQFAHSNDQEVKREVLLQQVAKDVTVVRIEGPEPLREVKEMVTSIQQITATMNESVNHIVGRQDEIKSIVDEMAKAIDAMTKARETVVQKAGDTGELPAIVEPLDALPPEGKTA